MQHLERYLVRKALRELYRLHIEVYMLLIISHNTIDRSSTAVFCYTLQIERESDISLSAAVSSSTLQVERKMGISPSKFLFVYSTST